MATRLADDFKVFLDGTDDDTAIEIIDLLTSKSTRPAGFRTLSKMTAKGPTGSRTTAARTEKKQTVRKRAKSNQAAATVAVAGTGMKRPLNSWMAFRKYYNKMLAPHTQKVISKALTLFWRADPSEAKWAILAKAYSILRGCREKKDASLDDFMALCAPLIGVIPPAEYLQTMGWQLSPPQDGEQMPQITRLFTPDYQTFPAEFMTTTVGVDDLVNYCYTMGYGNASNVGSPKTSTQGSLAMVSKPTTFTTDDRDETTQMAPFAQTNTILAFTAGTSNSNTNESIRQTLDSATSPTNIVSPSSLSVVPTAGQATLEQATILLDRSGVEYPYNNIFDPASDFDVSFDTAAPNTTVEDEGHWDGFDINNPVPLENLSPSFPWSDFLLDTDMHSTACVMKNVLCSLGRT